MSQKLKLSKVTIPSFSRKPEGGTAKCICAPTKHVLSTMGWGEPPDWQKSSTPAIGTLAATVISFMPKDSELSLHAFDLAVTEVRDFEFVRTQIKKGKKAEKVKDFRLELHFSVDFNDPEGAMKIEHYMLSVPESSAVVLYEREAVQDELPIAEEEAAQATLAAND
jgi:hypothetical protein